MSEKQLRKLYHLAINNKNNHNPQFKISNLHNHNQKKINIQPNQKNQEIIQQQQQNNHQQIKIKNKNIIQSQHKYQQQNHYYYHQNTKNTKNNNTNDKIEQKNEQQYQNIQNNYQKINIIKQRQQQQQIEHQNQHKIQESKNNKKIQSLNQLKKLLKINSGIKNVIRMENMLNMEESIHKRIRSMQRGMSPKYSMYKNMHPMGKISPNNNINQNYNIPKNHIVDLNSSISNMYNYSQQQRDNLKKQKPKNSMSILLPDLKQMTVRNSSNNTIDNVEISKQNPISNRQPNYSSIAQKVKEVKYRRKKNQEQQLQLKRNKSQKKKLFKNIQKAGISKSQSEQKKLPFSNAQLLPQYQKLIDDYIQKIKAEDLLDKYQNRQDLVRDACQHIKSQMNTLRQHDQIINYKSIQQQKSRQGLQKNEQLLLSKDKSNTLIKRNPSSLPKQYSNPYLQNIHLNHHYYRQNIKLEQIIPSIFRKSKRPSLGFIMNASYQQDVQIIKRNQILQHKRRDRQQRVFLRKMKMLGLYKRGSSQVK